MWINYFDFDKNLHIITIRNSKGHKTRTVPYGDQLRNTLRQYCIARGSVPTNTIIEKSIQSFFPQTNARGG